MYKSSKGDKYINLSAEIWSSRKDIHRSDVQKYNEICLNIVTLITWIMSNQKSLVTIILLMKIELSVSDFYFKQVGWINWKTGRYKYVIRVFSSLTIQILNNEKNRSGLLTDINTVYEK